jgi:hypothetical protein
MNPWIIYGLIAVFVIVIIIIALAASGQFDGSKQDNGQQSGDTQQQQQQQQQPADNSTPVTGGASTADSSVPSSLPSGDGSVTTAPATTPGPVYTSSTTVSNAKMAKSIRFYRKDPGIIHIANVTVYQTGSDGKLAVVPVSSFVKITEDSCRSCSGNYNTPHVPDGSNGENDPWYILYPPDPNNVKIQHTGNYGPNDSGNHFVQLDLDAPKALQQIDVTLRPTNLERANGTNLQLLDVNGIVIEEVPLQPVYAHSYTV